MKIQILGTGCPKCRQLTANAESAAREAGIEAQVEKITDLDEILRFGVMMTPALAIDGCVKSAGKVLPVAKIKEMLQGRSG